MIRGRSIRWSRSWPTWRREHRQGVCPRPEGTGGTTSTAASRRHRPSAVGASPRPRRFPTRRTRPEEGQDQQPEPVLPGHPAVPLARLPVGHRRVLPRRHPTGASRHGLTPTGRARHGPGRIRKRTWTTGTTPPAARSRSSSSAAGCGSPALSAWTSTASSTTAKEPSTCGISTPR